MNDGTKINQNEPGEAGRRRPAGGGCDYAQGTPSVLSESLVGFAW